MRAERLAVGFIDELHDDRLKARVDRHACLVGIGEIRFEIEQFFTAFVRKPSLERIARLDRFFGYRRVRIGTDRLSPESSAVVNVADLHRAFFDRLESRIDGHVPFILRSEIRVEIERLGTVRVRKPSDELVPRLDGLVGYRRVRIGACELRLIGLPVKDIGYQSHSLKSRIDGHARLVGIGEVRLEIEQLFTALVRKPPDKLVPLSERHSRYRRIGRSADRLSPIYLSVRHIVYFHDTPESGVNGRALLVRIGEISVEIERLRTIGVGEPTRERITVLVGRYRDRRVRPVRNVLYTENASVRDVSDLYLLGKSRIYHRVPLIGIGEISFEIE